MAFFHPSERNTCPRCQAHTVRLSHRRGPIERLLCALLRISPFRCEECDHRYYWFGSKRSHRTHRHA
jgi:hypothetical protein